jgi:hypothetical protein
MAGEMDGSGKSAHAVSRIFEGERLQLEQRLPCISFTTGMLRVASPQRICEALPEISVSRVPESLILSAGPSEAIASHMHLAHAGVEGSGNCPQPLHDMIREHDSPFIWAVPGTVFLLFFLNGFMVGIPWSGSIKRGYCS